MFKMLNKVVVYCGSPNFVRLLFTESQKLKIEI